MVKIFDIRPAKDGLIVRTHSRLIKFDHGEPGFFLKLMDPHPTLRSKAIEPLGSVPAIEDPHVVVTIRPKLIREGEAPCFDYDAVQLGLPVKIRSASV